MTSCSKVASVASKITLLGYRAMSEFTVRARRRDASSGEEAGEGVPVVLAARADRDAPLRRHGLARARARRPPGRRSTTRAATAARRPRRRRRLRLPGARRRPARGARRPRDRARGARPAPRWARTPSCGSRSTTATAWPGSCSITPAYTPEGEHARPRALGRARRRAARRRRRGLRRGLRRAAACPRRGARR